MTIPLFSKELLVLEQQMAEQQEVTASPQPAVSFWLQPVQGRQVQGCVQSLSHTLMNTSWLSTLSFPFPQVRQQKSEEHTKFNNADKKHLEIAH